MQSIQEPAEKIKKEQGKIVLVVLAGLILVLFGLGMFLLGRFSAQNGSMGNNEVIIEYPPLVANYGAGSQASVAQTTTSSALHTGKTGQLVASKNGTRYYPLDCGGVSRIKEENKTYFNSITEAENAGYEPAAGCF